MSVSKKSILVIGATGAQGMAVVDALLAPAADGSPSPWAVRALTRDASHRRAQELRSRGVEIFQGELAALLRPTLLSWLTAPAYHSRYNR